MAPPRPRPRPIHLCKDCATRRCRGLQIPITRLIQLALSPAGEHPSRYRGVRFSTKRWRQLTYNRQYGEVSRREDLEVEPQILKVSEALVVGASKLDRSG
jgi:hypothetical protein